MSFLLKLHNTDQKCIGWFYLHFFCLDVNLNVSTVLFSQCCNGWGEFTTCGLWKYTQLGGFGHTTSPFCCCSVISFIPFTQHIVPQWNLVSVDGCNTGHLVLCNFNFHAMFSNLHGRNGMLLLFTASYVFVEILESLLQISCGTRHSPVVLFMPCF